MCWLLKSQWDFGFGVVPAMFRGCCCEWQDSFGLIRVVIQLPAEVIAELLLEHSFVVASVSDRDL